MAASKLNFWDITIVHTALQARLSLGGVCSTVHEARNAARELPEALARFEYVTDALHRVREGLDGNFPRVDSSRG